MNRLLNVVRRLFVRCIIRMGFTLPVLLRWLLPRKPHRDYRAVWIEPSGALYRQEVYERQRAGGRLPLTENPTIGEIRAILQADGVRTVLEVGCGWGRLTIPLQDSFQMSGCDVSEEMLRLCPVGLDVFCRDIAVEDSEWLRVNAGRWDAVFTRGVILYLTTPDQINQAMQAMLAVCRGRIHIWEWQEDCDAMRAICADDRFAYHPILHRTE